jgi:hypothetical protein
MTLLPGGNWLQSQLVTDAGSYDGLTATTDRLYWMYTLDDGNGTPHAALWTAPRSGGPARQLSADVGAPVFWGSQYDLQPVGDRLYWAATRPGHPDQTELRSIPLTGGTVTVQVLDGAWAMSRWPWLVTAQSPDQPTRLRNVTTGQIRTVRTPASHQLSCSPTWCRIIPDQATETDLIRPDGTDLRASGTPRPGRSRATSLLDRYEALMSAQGVVSQTDPLRHRATTRGVRRSGDHGQRPRRLHLVVHRRQRAAHLARPRPAHPRLTARCSGLCAGRTCHGLRRLPAVR